MPVMILGRRRQASTERAFRGPVVVATINRAFSGLVVLAATQRLRTFSGVYARAATLDPNSIPLPPVGGAYVVTHHGLPQEATDYTVRMREGDAAPTLEATLRGQVTLSGEVSITVRAGDHRQTYGPFGALGYTFSRTPTGWITQVTSADMSAADAEADSPYIQPFTSEYLPWERERDLTPYQQALKARNDALREREVRQRQEAREKDLQRQLNEEHDPAKRRELRCAISRLRKQAKDPPDRRRVPVQSVIRMALAALPIPFSLGAALPYGGDFFWASEDTGVSFNGGKLIGVSFQVKGKTPVQVLEELLGPIGWQVVIKFGEAYIGPPESLQSAEETPGTLDLPADLLTGLSIEQVNPEAAQGNGNRQLPRRITITGASARKVLLPLPPEPDHEPDETDFQEQEDITFSGSSYVEGYSAVTGQKRVESRTTWEKVKAGGLLRRETSETHGLVPTFQLTYTGGQWGAVLERWTLQEKRKTTYLYTDPRYGKALTEQLTTVAAYAEPVDRVVDPAETTRITQEWHPEGWLRRKVTTKETIGEWQTWTSEDRKTIITWATLTYESEVEEWLPVGKDQWSHKVTRKRGSYWPMFEEGDPADPQRRMKTEVLVDGLTDQGPERAPEDGDNDDDCGEEKEAGDGYPYDEALEQVLLPGGRGDAVTRSAPWATSIPPVWLENVVGSIRRARPAKRTKYEVAAPPRVQVGTRIKDFSLTGKAAGVRATITVEEALDV